MKIANPIYDRVLKYLLENGEVAKAILAAILKEDVVFVEPLDDETTQKLASIVRHIGKVIMRNPDLLYVISMEDFMEAEAQRECRANEQREQRLEASEKARNEAEKARNEIAIDNEILREELQKLRLQLQDRNSTPSV